MFRHNEICNSQDSGRTQKGNMNGSYSLCYVSDEQRTSTHLKECFLKGNNEKQHFIQNLATFTTK